MKNWLCLLLLVNIFNVYSWGPPLFRFYIKNATGEPVFLHYKLAEDFSAGIATEYRDADSNIDTILKNNEILEIEVTHTVQYNKKYTGEMYFEKGYISVTDFMSVFGDFSFTLLETNKVLYREDMKQEYIKYTMDNPGKLTHFFILEVPQEE
jgi:hypothetical protein